MQVNKWHLRFLSIAKEVSTWSKDPSTQIGAVAVKDKVILSTGYNGFPRSIEDSESRYNNRQEKYRYIVHGEMNCIYNATHIGAKLDGSDLYVYGLPTCSECAKGIIQVGVKKVFVCYPENIKEKWSESEKLSSDMYKQAGVDYYRL
jgi:dCMP deaminase